ncbi:MAG TPA: hypothetical protein VK163_01290 [Opitutaceae bacterium]|nr:hypothetical protein [Opitutaceae bacterium]
MSQSAYAAAIVDFWVAAGCPPVTDADRAMQQLRELEKHLPTKPKAEGKGGAAARKAS